MNSERLNNLKFLRNDPLVSNFINSVLEQVENEKDKSPYIYYADTSQSTNITHIQPEHFQQFSLEEAEIRMDEFLYANWSKYEGKHSRWPHLRTVIDPKSDIIYKIEEFPVVLDSRIKLSVKQSYKKDDRLIALSYRLATL